MDEMSVRIWKPLSFLNDISRETFALMILNAPIALKKDTLALLWNKARLRVTVDGGTDRWLKWLSDSRVNIVHDGIPDLVTGDFDSIHPKTLSRLQEKSVEVVGTPNQDNTDFTKAVQYLQQKEEVKHIVAVSEISGRMDQILSQINTLFLCDIPITLLSSACASWLLRPGKHEIEVEDLLSNPLLSEDRWVALMPVGSPARVTTSGLKWDLENSELKFGGLVSSSNTYNGESVIKISTDQPLLWSMGLSMEELP